jgi:hypothetical protein
MTEAVFPHYHDWGIDIKHFLTDEGLSSIFYPVATNIAD